ncbi:MAG: hypothetical protein J07HQW2_03254, partial [Haloquadratum walsbyi J07HQW2]
MSEMMVRSMTLISVRSSEYEIGRG